MSNPEKRSWSFLLQLGSAGHESLLCVMMAPVPKVSILSRSWMFPATAEKLNLTERSQLNEANPACTILQMKYVGRWPRNGEVCVYNAQQTRRPWLLEAEMKTVRLISKFFPAPTSSSFGSTPYQGVILHRHTWFKATRLHPKSWLKRRLSMISWNWRFTGGTVTCITSLPTLSPWSNHASWCNLYLRVSIHSTQINYIVCSTQLLHDTLSHNSSPLGLCPNVSASDLLSLSWGSLAGWLQKGPDFLCNAAYTSSGWVKTLYPNEAQKAFDHVVIFSNGNSIFYDFGPWLSDLLLPSFWSSVPTP